MTLHPTDEEREQRITYEIIVDCFNDYEVATGWYCYLADKLSFPFVARWNPSSVKTSSALTTTEGAEMFQVVGMADEEDCKADILVSIKYCEQERTDEFLVPLAELDSVENNMEPQSHSLERLQAIGDWQYWLAQGNQLFDPDASDPDINEDYPSEE